MQSTVNLHQASTNGEIEHRDWQISGTYIRRASGGRHAQLTHDVETFENGDVLRCSERIGIVKKFDRAILSCSRQAPRYLRRDICEGEVTRREGRRLCQ